MNPTQIQTTLAPIIATISGILAAKFSFFDGATWGALLSGAISMAAIVWGAFAARKAGVTNSAASYADTTVVTDAKTAAATTSPSVQSNTEVKVVSK